ncbi:MAG: hypothetical protein GY799_22255 [Desulfobulbaceae bacterium]|nr:hypothetical protein [Desulfobulbaceae bacterium]
MITIQQINKAKLELNLLERDHEEQYMLKIYRFYEIVKYTSDDGLSVVRSFYSEQLPESQYDRHDFCTENDNCKCYYCVYGR